MFWGAAPNSFFGAPPQTPARGAFFPPLTPTRFQIYRCIRNTRDNPYPNLSTSAGLSDRTPRRHKLRSTPFDRKGRISVPLRCSSFSQKVKDFLGALINGKATYGSFPLPSVSFRTFLPHPTPIRPFVHAAGFAYPPHIISFRPSYNFPLITLPMKGT